MGKKGSSWLTAVKRAFRSPSKESDKSSIKRREETEAEDNEKKREKRRWLFRKHTQQEQQIDHKPAASRASEAAAADQRHAIAVAVATAAAAESAVATAQAAVEVVLLTRPSSFAREHYAAVVIQTAFRGYLARRALKALKGLVKLQALVRGHNVRKQANMTLRCMQALVRVQARVRDQRLTVSNESNSKSSLSDSTSFWQSRCLQDLSDRKSIYLCSSQSRDGISVADDWDDRPHTIEEIQAMLQQRKEAALKREKALAYAFSHQIWKSGKNIASMEESDTEERPNWFDRWMATRSSWENRGRASTDQRDFIKTVEMDTARPFSYSSANVRRFSQHQSSYSMSSPLHKARYQASLHHSPITPSSAKAHPIQVRSASPRFSREERPAPAVHTPSLAHYNNSGFRHHHHGAGAAVPVPNYMAATESAKARLRSQSAPKQRPSTPERDRASSVRKRLSFPVPDTCGSERLRSPSFKSLHEMERRSNMSSCYTDSLVGEVSPSSTTDLRRWLR